MPDLRPVPDPASGADEARVHRGKQRRRSATAFFLAVLVPALVTAPLFWVGYRVQWRAVTNLLEVNRVNQVSLQEKEYTQHFRGIVSDLLYIAGHDDLSAGLDAPGYFEESGFLHEVCRFVRHKPLYGHIRLLDATGVERWHISSSGQHTVVLPEDQLQDKSQQPYFEAAMQLQPFEVYVSRFDLQLQNGLVGDPPNPVVRFATPVRSPSTGARGLLVIGVNGADIIRGVKRLHAGLPGHPLLLDGDGYFMIGPAPELEWGFMYPGGADHTLRALDPEAWEIMAREQSGLFYTDRGLYSFRSIYPEWEARKAALPGVRLADELHEAHGPRWIIASFLARDGLLARTQPVRALFTWAAVFLAFMILFAAWFGARFYNLRHATRFELQRANERLSKTVEDLSRSYSEIEMVNEMEDFLQSCDTTEEVYGVVRQYASRIFPLDSGALYIHLAEEQLLEQILSWGIEIEPERHVAGQACWAFRRNQAHLVQPGDAALMCAHQAAAAPGGSICLPMGAKGELIGMLHIKRKNRACPLTGRSFDRSLEATLQIASSIAEHVALTITNIRLRDELRSQSIRDPLTELFNRRYMEETFEREWRRAQRKDHPLAVILFDVDHFKALNDAHGHEAGDAVLAQLGRLLRDNVRAGDVPCRYGGEEFLVIMPEAGLQSALDRAESLRAKVEQLAIGYQGHTLRLTISLGVALFPGDGDTPEAVISAADAALYAAKRAGRNRVMGAEAPHPAESTPARDE